MRIDAAGDHDLSGGVDHTRAIRHRQAAGRGDRGDLVAGDQDVMSADTLRRHHPVAANHQIDHAILPAIYFASHRRLSTASRQARADEGDGLRRFDEIARRVRGVGATIARGGWRNDLSRQVGPYRLTQGLTVLPASELFVAFLALTCMLRNCYIGRRADGRNEWGSRCPTA